MQVSKQPRVSLESVNNQGNFGELLGVVKDMLNSIIGLVEELKLSIRSTRKSGLVHDMGEVIKETKNINDSAVGKNLNRETLEVPKSSSRCLMTQSIMRSAAIELVPPPILN